MNSIEVHDGHGGLASWMAGWLGACLVGKLVVEWRFGRLAGWLVDSGDGLAAGWNPES